MNLTVLLGLFLFKSLYNLCIVLKHALWCEMQLKIPHLFS